MDGGSRVLLLWDIDHTLIENEGVSKETYRVAFRKLTGRFPVIGPQTGGRTDSEIMRDLLVANGVTLSVELEARIESVVAAAGAGLVDLLEARGYVLPGVLDAVRAVDRQAAIVQSVLTGNIRPNAENKLRLLKDTAALLDLDVGAYGSDDTVRARLVSVAQGRAGEKYGTSFDQSSTVLVGDTPRDVAAAIEGGAGCIAVATGDASMEELEEAGADQVFANLSATDEVMSAILKLTGHH